MSAAAEPEAELLHRGLGLVVHDPKLSAGRGAQFSASTSGEDVGPLDDDDGGPQQLHFYPRGDATRSASASVPLDATNKGYQLLQKLGWRQGAGLGRNEDGIVEPVSAGVDAGVRLGLGKQAQDDVFTAAEGITRRKLEVEIQAEEDPERRQRREAQAARDQAIREDVSTILKTFLCQTCNKQYQTAMELEAHLSSYDHHHTKRLAEARAAEMERTRGERQKKEQRRQQREQQRLEEQIRKAQAAAPPGGGSQQQQQPPLPPLPPLPAVSQQPHGAAAAPDSSSGGWGWSSQPAAPPPPPPPPPAAPPSVGGSSSGWSQPAVAAVAAPPPPPPPPAGAGAQVGGSMRVSLKPGGALRLGRGAGAAGGRGLQRLGAAAGRGGAKPVAVFGDSSSSEDDGGVT